jgi:hypothetical protein
MGIKCFILFETFVQNNICLLNTVGSELCVMHNMFTETICKKHLPHMGSYGWAPAAASGVMSLGGTVVVVTDVW